MLPPRPEHTIPESLLGWQWHRVELTVGIHATARKHRGFFAEKSVLRLAPELRQRFGIQACAGPVMLFSLSTEFQEHK
jgi:hypothetical protein